MHAVDNESITNTLLMSKLHCLHVKHSIDIAPTLLYTAQEQHLCLGQPSPRGSEQALAAASHPIPRHCSTQPIRTGRIPRLHPRNHDNRSIHCANVQCTRSHIIPAPHVRLRDPAIAAPDELHHSIQYGATGPPTQAHGARMIDVRGRNDAYRNHRTPYGESVQRESCTLREYLCMCTQETAGVPADTLCGKKLVY
ncbi:hypothetical protein M513_14112 [Trichuris suis]|uniref:Uncharacterized protein n=1 Tax=Trichuris suis TaxID=68888 RepID=A0A085LJ65_9BILA|nr:hypothetical protein M513_14112 [Trichuris suis]